MSLITDFISNLWRPKKFGSTTFYPIANLNLWENSSYLDAFNQIPEVNAVLNMKARMFSNGIIKALDKNNNELELPEIIRRPNWFQDTKEFLRQTKLFHDLFGEEYLYFLFPVGFDKLRSKAIYTIPPNLISQEYEGTQAFFNFTERPKELKYYIHNNGSKSVIDPEQVVFLNDNKVSIKKINDSDIFGGESKLIALRPAIKNIKMAYESRGIILKYRGALGILSNRTTDGVGAGIPLDETEIKNIQEKYQQYGGLDGQFQIIISNANLQWQQMNISPDKLGLFQETEADFDKILDSYGLPPELFVRPEGSTYENQIQAERNAYLRTIIPEANEWIGAVSQSLFPDGKIKLIMDYNHLFIFHEDSNKKSQTVQTMVNSLSKLLQDGIITTAEYRQEIEKLGIGKNQS